MAEIPEHLLRRSREAKSRTTDEPTEAAAEEAQAEPEAEEPSPEPVEEAEPEVAAPPPVAAPGKLEPVMATPVARPKPAPAYAPPSRPTGTAEPYRGAPIPAWLIPAFVLVPVLIIALGMAIVNAVQEEGGETAGPDGAAIFTQSCAACHGPEGGGGVGPALNATVDVFPDFQAMFEWVTTVASETDGPYGEGGTGNAGKGATPGAMPAFDGVLSQEEIYAVVAHEREVFSGADPSTFPPAEEYGGPPAGEGESAEAE